MKNYVVSKKCIAKEFVLVKADTKQEALEKAKTQGKLLGNSLEFVEYLDIEEWAVEPMSGKEVPSVVEYNHFWGY